MNSRSYRPAGNFFPSEGTCKTRSKAEVITLDLNKDEDEDERQFAKPFRAGSPLMMSNQILRVARLQPGLLLRTALINMVFPRTLPRYVNPRARLRAMLRCWNVG